MKKLRLLAVILFAVTMIHAACTNNPCKAYPDCDGTDGNSKLGKKDSIKIDTAAHEKMVTRI